LRFISDTIGEMWYKLKLESHKSDSIEMPCIEVELGKSDFVEVNLSNPIEEPIVYN